MTTPPHVLVKGELIALASNLRKLAEKYCNDDSWSYADEQRQREMMDRARDLLEKEGLPEPRFNHDPRGPFIKLKERPDDWPWVNFVGEPFIPDEL